MSFGLARAIRRHTSSALPVNTFAFTNPTASYVQTASSVTVPREFTVEFWFKGSPTIGASCNVVSVENYAGAGVLSGWDMDMWANGSNATIGLSASFYNGASSGQSAIGATFSPNTWNHVALRVRLNTSTGLYEGQPFLNGVGGGAVANSAFSAATHAQTEKVRLGITAGPGLTPSQPGYSIDELRIWNYPRTDTEISSNYSKTVDPSDTRLIFRAGFDGTLAYTGAATGGAGSGTLSLGSGSTGSYTTKAF